MEKHKKKSFIVKGNLKDKVLYKFLPNELSQGLWFIRLQSLCYSINGVGIQAICKITCNLVTSLQNSSDNSVINEEEPFAIFMFDPKVKRKAINFDEKWLNINIYSSELIFTIKSIEIDENIKIDCDVFFLVEMIKKQ
jgi:hypothetical protein